MIEVEERFGPTAPTLDWITSKGFEGSVFADGIWVPLSSYDLAGRQRAAGTADRSSYLRSVLRGHGLYVNNVLFTPT